jgi:hypothetical protein
LSALTEQVPGLCPVFGWRRFRFAPSIARDTALLLPLFFGEWRLRRPLARRDMERMIRAQASLRIAARWRAGMRVMDQGPIYTLGTLHLRHPRIAEAPRLESWFGQMERHWARLLDTVIYLDAPDDVLLQRIGERSKDHRLKTTVDEDGLVWLASLRGELERTVDRLRACSPLTMLRFDTGGQDPAALLNRVRRVLDHGFDATLPGAARRSAAPARR